MVLSEESLINSRPRQFSWKEQHVNVNVAASSAWPSGGESHSAMIVCLSRNIQMSSDNLKMILVCISTVVGERSWQCETENGMRGTGFGVLGVLVLGCWVLGL